MIGRLLLKTCSKNGQKSLQKKIQITALCKGYLGSSSMIEQNHLGNDQLELPRQQQPNRS